jgi:hypothetical protein
MKTWEIKEGKSVTYAQCLIFTWFNSYIWWCRYHSLRRTQWQDCKWTGKDVEGSGSRVRVFWVTIPLVVFCDAGNQPTMYLIQNNWHPFKDSNHALSIRMSQALRLEPTWSVISLSNISVIREINCSQQN